MGYYSTFEGHISLQGTRLGDGELEELKAVVDDVFYGNVRVDETGVHFDYLEGKYYGFEDDVKSLVEMITSWGHNVFGQIDAFGEESGDIWRVIIRDNKVVRESAKIVWPDGSEYVR